MIGPGLRALYKPPLRGGFFILALSLALGGCGGFPTLPDDWVDSVERGEGFDHRTIRRATASGDCLRVFIEGDGRPWIGGTRVAADPTPADPVLLRIAIEVPGRVLYLGRPCYFGLAKSAACDAEDWTFGRYSDEVVRSMSAVVAHHAAAEGVERVALVGHSGGGTLAVLMAGRLPQTGSVLTLAAPLDLKAWTQLHGYTPLFRSLDPADRPPLPDAVRQLHLVGGRDDNVPASLNRRYLLANPAPVRLMRDMRHELDDVPTATWGQRIDGWLDELGCGSG